MRGGKRKWYENGSSALFMDPTEECGWWLVMVVVSQSSRACLYLCTYEYTDSIIIIPSIFISLLYIKEPLTVQ